MEIREMPNGGLRATLTLRGSRWFDMLSARHQGALLAPEPPSIAVSRPAGALLATAGLVGLILVSDLEGAFDTSKHRGQAYLAMAVIGLPLLVELEWRAWQSLRPRQLVVAVGRGQVVVGREGARLAEVDGPLETCRFAASGNALLVEHSGTTRRYVTDGSPRQVGALVERLHAAQRAWGGREDVPDALTRLGEPE